MARGYRFVEGGMGQIRIGWRRLFGELAGWARIRWFLAGGIAVAVAVALMSSTGALGSQTAVPGGVDEVVSWWVYPVIVIGALGSSLLIASYVRAPIGAGATFCDLRWPLFALTGIALATGSRTTGATFADVLAGPPGSMAEIARISVGVAAVLLLAWALRGRMALERAAQGSADSGEGYPACTGCRPLFR